MKTRTLKTAGAMAIFVVVMAAQSASAYYNPSTGRWLNRDSLEESAGYNIYEFAENRPLSVVDLFGLGTWNIQATTLDLTDPKYSLKALQHANEDGFTVIYVPGTGECPNGTIIVYQTIEEVGFMANSPPHVDNTPPPYHHPTTGCPVPPAAVPSSGVPYSYVDSPTSKALTHVVWELTAVAVCRANCKDKLLSTYYFEFDNDSRQISTNNLSNLSNYNTAMGTWGQ